MGLSFNLTVKMGLFDAPENSFFWGGEIPILNVFNVAHFSQKVKIIANLHQNIEASISWS